MNCHDATVSCSSESRFGRNQVPSKFFQTSRRQEFGCVRRNSATEDLHEIQLWDERGERRLGMSTLVWSRKGKKLATIFECACQRIGLFDRDLQIHCGTLEPDVCRGTGLKQRPFSMRTGWCRVICSHSHTAKYT